jgi:hypothetical protein
MTIDKRVRFEETYVSEDYGTTTHYFTIEKSLLEELFPNKYPEACRGEISVEFPTDCPDAREAEVCISPTEYDEENDGYTDYDWNDVSIPYEEVEALFDLAKN